MGFSLSFPYILSLIKLQKRVLRIIKSAPYRAHTEPLFQELNILPFYKIFQYSVIIFIFKCFNNMLPPLFAQLYLKNCDLHNYDTRNSNKLIRLKRIQCVFFILRLSLFEFSHLYNFFNSKFML